MKNLLFIISILTGFIATAQDSIVYNSCKAYFKFELNTTVRTFAPATVIDFYDKSEGNVIQWLWEFGDGTTSTEQNPMHIFNHPIDNDSLKKPVYPFRDINLTITTLDGCESTYTEKINIFDVFPDEEGIAKADFKYYLLSIDPENETATFQLENRSKGDQLSYFWEFDNGVTKTDSDPEITIDYNNSENKVCLTVTDVNNISDIFCDAVYLSSFGSDSTVYNDSIYLNKLEFSYSINNTIEPILPGIALDFYTRAGAKIVKWDWDFGDGSTSNEENPMHLFNYPIVDDSIIYDDELIYEVCLTVTTEMDSVYTYCETIDIYNIGRFDAECFAGFKYFLPRDLITIPEVIPCQFNYWSEYEVVDWLWEFEDGSTSTESDPLVMFDFSKPEQKVCLTITSAEGCKSTYCETVYLSNEPVDTIIMDSYCPYSIKFESDYPVTASSCIGTAKALVYSLDSLVGAENYYWSDGTEGPDVNGLCPTEVYSVKVITHDGCKLGTSFIFNSDGTVTHIPVNWWINQSGDDSYIDSDYDDSDFTLEWVLCDGTVLRADSIPVNSIACETGEANLRLKDAAGNVVYTEQVSITTLPTAIEDVVNQSGFELYPNPAIDVLNVCLIEANIEANKFEIIDISGKTIISKAMPGLNSEPKLTIDISALQNGIYFGRIVSENKVVGIKRFIK